MHHVGLWISQADTLPCISHVSPLWLPCSSPVSPLHLVWVAQAEARQRAGRAGRVRAGHNFKLYTSWRHTQLMQAARTPEMLRGPLQEVCLQLRLAPLLAWPARCAHQCSESSNRLKRAAAMAMVRCEFVVLSQWYEALRNVSNCCVGCAGRE